MKKFAERVIHALAMQLGYNNLSGAFRRFLLVIGAYTVASMLSNSYFSVFLLRVTGSEIALMRYNLLLAAVQPFVMLLAVVVLRKCSTAICLRIGLLLHALAYGMLFVIGEPDETMVYVLSALFASGNAFYFTSYTPLMLAYTEDRSRDTAFSVISLISNALSLTLPLLTGVFITALGDLTGYSILFLLSAAVLLFGFGMSFRLKSEPQDRTPKLRATARRMISNPDMRDAMTITAVNGLRFSVSGYYVSLLVYALLKQEAVMGVVTTVCAIAGLGMNMVYGRVLKPNRRGESMMLGTVVLLAGVLFLSVNHSPTGYVVFALVNAITATFIDVPVSTIYMSVLQHDEQLAGCGAEVHAMREFWVAAGRVLGVLPVFFIPAVSEMPTMMIMIITVLQLPIGWMAMRMRNRLKTE